MVGIASLGVGSGLDLKGLVDKLVAAEAQGPTRALNAKEQRLTLDLSGYGLLSSAMADFQAALGKINSGSAFPSRSVTVSDKDFFTASVDATAKPGTYNVEVESLLEAQTLQSGPLEKHPSLFGGPAGPDDGVGYGQITIKTADNRQLVVDVPGGGLLGADPRSANEIVDFINNAADPAGVAVSARVEGNTSIVIDSLNPGTDNAVASINVVEGGLLAGDGTDNVGLSQLAFDADPMMPVANMSVVKAAADASIKVTDPSGTDLNIAPSGTSETFTFNGITINALQVTGQVETLTIIDSTGDAKGVIQQFVDSFNALQTAIDDLGFADTVGDKDGLLVGDSILRGVENQLRRVVFTEVAGQPANLRYLTFTGIGFDDQGKLQIDDDKLQDAIDNNFDALSSLFGGENGLGKQFDELLGSYTGSGGILPSKTDSLNRQVADVADDRETLAARLERIEARLVVKFGALDALVAQLNSTGSYLDQQLVNITSIITNPVNRAGG